MMLCIRTAAIFGLARPGADGPVYGSPKFFPVRRSLLQKMPTARRMAVPTLR